MTTQNTDRALSPAQIALARSRTYTLLSQLTAEGITQETWPMVQQLDYFTDALANVEFDLDSVAATHQDIFGFSITPYQSVFLDTTSMLGGDETNRLLESYRLAGVPSVAALVESPSFAAILDTPDHIATELALLAFLCGAEADAREDGLGAVSLRMTNLQQEFLRTHLLRWLPPLVVAIGQERNPFYTALSQLLWDFVTDHVTPVISMTYTASKQLNWQLPTPPNLLEDDKTTLKDIAAFLLRPAYTGIYLSRSQLRRLARQHRLPHGFGEREVLLTNMLKSAVQYDIFATFVQALMAEIDHYQRQYKYLCEEQDEAIAFIIQPWQTRTDEANEFLRKVETMASELAE
ncbi:MAG: molecular chaperone TorD family protein [Chloroflexota bacterium]